MADTHKTRGQDVHQEAADKFTCLQCHQLLPVIPVVFVPELYLVVLDVNDALIADRDTMCITRQVPYNGVCLVQAVSAIDYPLFLHQGIEHCVYFTGFCDAMELTVVRTAPQGCDQIASVVARQGFYREQVVTFRRMPLLVVA